MTTNKPLERLRHHVSGAIARGEAKAIVAVPAKTKGDLSRENYRTFAQDAIAQYERKGMIIDAMLWNAIMDHCDADLKRKDDALFAALSVLSMANVPDGTTHTSKQAFELVLAALPNT
jgi:hypothetical protein